MTVRGEHAIHEPSFTQPRRRLGIRTWSTARVSVLLELSQPLRMSFTAARLAVQILLVASLWQALYKGATTREGLDVHQTVAYAVLAVLINQQGGVDRFVARDSVLQHIQEGTILYWYLRPISARRYHLIRAIGDQCYGLCWAVVGFAVCWAVGFVRLPSLESGSAFVVLVLVGQVILYHLSVCVDLICFWTVTNQNAVQIYRFVQTLLSGAFAPLWFFPGWFVTIAHWLPFQSIISLPLDIYVGRTSPDRIGSALAEQGAWILALFLFSRWLWSRAGHRIAVQGG